MPRRAGQQGDGALLTPKERRQMNDYEVKMQDATRVARKAWSQKMRWTKDIYKHTHTHTQHGIGEGGREAKKRKKPQNSCRRRAGNGGDMGGKQKKCRNERVG